MGQYWQYWLENCFVLLHLINSRSRMKLFTTTLLTFIFTITISYAQTIDSKIVDPYGFVTKYDTTFNGIGPSVYILPLPRTLKDEMTDIYEDLLSFEDSIHLMIKIGRAHV